MRIAINAAFLGERHSGLTTCTGGLAESLRRIGHDVVVYGSSPRLVHLERVKLARTPSHLTFDKGPFATLLRFAWNQVCLPVRLWRENIDLVFCHNAEGIFWCPTQQVLIIHDLIPLLYPAEAPRLHIYYRRLLPLFLKRMSAVIAVSQYGRTDLVHTYPLNADKVQVIYNGIDPEVETRGAECKPQDLYADRYFMFIGSFAPRKNLDTVTRAFAKVHSEIRESLLVVAYPDRWMKDYVSAIGKMGIREKVTILSGLSKEELRFAYRHATSLFLLSEYEGFGFPLLEAMLMGTPAVVSDSTALSEVAGDAAIKLRAHDVDAAAETMLALSKNDRYRDGVRKMGLKRSREFTLNRVAEQLNQLLSGIVQTRTKQDPRNASLPA